MTKVDVNILAGYTYLNPISLNKDSTYLSTFSDTVTAMLKYRTKHLAKIDIELTYKKIALGFSSRYNSFMENIDQTFVDPFLGNLILPGYAAYRDVRRVGDLVLDARASFKIKSSNTIPSNTKTRITMVYINRILSRSNKNTIKI